MDGRVDQWNWKRAHCSLRVRQRAGTDDRLAPRHRAVAQTTPDAPSASAGVESNNRSRSEVDWTAKSTASRTICCSSMGLLWVRCGSTAELKSSPYKLLCVVYTTLSNDIFRQRRQQSSAFRHAYLVVLLSRWTLSNGDARGGGLLPSPSVHIAYSCSCIHTRGRPDWAIEAATRPRTRRPTSSIANRDVVNRRRNVVAFTGYGGSCCRVAGE